ncbi:nuclear movement CS domain-containing protein [Vairimorpha necatrix]|uniref:Nuclear movement CS domain-containing protein n=1 Tax=Vairimorpha necatrix TaxID=6039 RepID=A0AAX4JA04_9MICR
MPSSYSWKQDLNEVQVSFPLKESDKIRIKSTIKDRNIKIKYNGEIVLEGVLFKRIQVGFEFWLKNEEDQTIDFFFPKKANDWWESLLEGSEKVDTDKLAEESEGDFSMLDPETRASIEKMAYNFHRQNE